MKKAEVFCVAGFIIIAVASFIDIRLQTPREPVIVQYQAKAPELTEQTTESTAPQTDETVVVSTAAETQFTETVPQENHNLNTATAADLQRVSGIGTVLSQEILAYRAQIGGFVRRAQLMEINGIGDVLTEYIMAEFYIPDELPPEEPVAPYIPEYELVLEEPDAPAEELLPEEPVPYDVNTVTREELLTIPDMTEETADAILALREQIGRFLGIYEVSLAENLSGMYFETVLRQYLYVADDPYSIAQP